MVKRVLPFGIGASAIAAAAAVGLGLVQFSPRISVALVGLVTVLFGALVILAWRGSRGLSSLALAAAALTLGMNGVRLTASVALSDIFLLGAAMTLLPGVLFPAGQQRLAPVWPLLRSTLLIVLGGIAGSFFAPSPVASFSQLVRFSVAAMLVPVIFALWNPSLPEIRRIAWLWVFSVTLSSLTAMTERAAYLEGRSDGLTTHPNHLALTCVIALGAAIVLTLLERGILQLIGVGCCGVMGIAIIISGSRAGVLACAVTALTIAVFSRRLAVAGGIAAAAVAYVVALAIGIISLPAGNALARLFGSEDQAISQSVSNSDAERRAALDQVIEQIKQNPLTGTGFQSALDAHNIYLQLMGSAGILGLAGFALVIITVTNTPVKGYFSRGRPADPAAMLLLVGLSSGYLGYLVMGMFANALWDRYLWLTPSLIAVLVPHALGYLPSGQKSSSPATQPPRHWQPQPAGAASMVTTTLGAPPMRPSGAGLRPRRAESDTQ